MSTRAKDDLMIQPAVDLRVLQEGYGPGAWHGPDLKAALADVTADLALWRPSPGRHNIAELALHHAYYARAVRTQVSGRPAEPFVLPGEDWFEVSDEARLSWADIRTAVDVEQARLRELIEGIEDGTTSSPAAAEERFGLVLGITCHAIYHAGQVQLLKRLHRA